MPRYRLLTALILTAILTASVSAQVTARQGPPEEQQFQSPMILEVPFRTPTQEIFDAAVKKAGLGYIDLEFPSVRENLDGYVCEDVSISDITAMWRRPAKNGRVPVRLTFVLKTRPGHDKLVQLQLMFIGKDGKALGPPFVIRDIDAEEGKLATAQVWTSFPHARIDEEGTKLFIRLSAEEH